MNTPTETCATTDLLVGLSPTALRALRECARMPNPTCQHPMAGYGRGPILSSCRALVRKGLMWGTYSGQYGLTEKGIPIAREALRRYRAERQTFLLETDRAKLAEGTSP
jgi:hypothetical protein